jgi:phosphatidylglycerophosphatase A
MVKSIYLAIATGLGSGYLRPASGTWGTLVGIPLVLLFSTLSPLGYFLAMLATFFIGVKASEVAEKHFGESDSGNIVIDEIVGLLLTMYLVPVGFWNLFWAFFFFRFFDIAKFWPARQIDRAGAGGLGVMADDVAAAVYANILLQIFCTLGWLGCGWN